MAKELLLVEDEPDILDLAVLRLEKANYRLLIARTAEEALKILNTKEMPDLVLLDLLLPKMQGDELCKKLKADAKFKHIPIILFTASIIRVPEKVADIGADDYILKPFEAEELLYKIKKLIG